MIFTKVVRIGRLVDVNGSLFCKISWDGSRLSICGVEAPRRDGNCAPGCGCGQTGVGPIAEYAPGWDEAKAARFAEIWDRWHLNDLTAGSPAQEAFLRANPIEDRANYFDTAVAALIEAGLQPDKGYLHNGEPYRYGSAWLKEDVPAEVLGWLLDLPDTDRTPAWV